jgi:hypothetical protein
MHTHQWSSRTTGSEPASKCRAPTMAAFAWNSVRPAWLSLLSEIGRAGRLSPRNVRRPKARPDFRQPSWYVIWTLAK